MSWIRLDTSYHTHRKTHLLRSKIGHAAYWVMPRLWCYAAENERDGDFSAYQAQDIARIVDYTGNAENLIACLQEVGFMDGMKIHEWMEHNGYAQAASRERARKGATGRWRKFHSLGDNSPQSKTNETNGTYVTKRNVSKHSFKQCFKHSSKQNGNEPS